ncbi:MAG: hypothetical protein ACRDOO_13985 [Actinomadura sp.]
MSYEQLMQHAEEIRLKAIAKALDRFGDQHDPRTGTIRAQKRPALERAFADIPAIFQPWADMPAPASFDPMIDEMNDALRVISPGQDPKDPVSGVGYTASPVLTKINGAVSYVEDWTGQAAMEFKAGFLDPFPAIVRNQFIVAAVLKGALDAYKGLWVNARSDIDQIAHKVIVALDGVNDRCDKNEWSITFTVVAAVASIAAVPLSGGALYAVTAVGAGSSMAAGAPPKDAPTNEFSGESPEAVISSMGHGISKLAQEIGNAERTIANALQKTQGVLSADRKSFVSRRPALAGATPRNIRSSKYMGYTD